MIKMQQRTTLRATQLLDDERSTTSMIDQDPDNYRLPLYHRKNVKKDGEFSTSKWIHVIPLIVFSCIFILWWFSYPVEVVINDDGNIVARHSIDAPLHLNESNHVELAILATATATDASPIAALPVNLTTDFDAVNITTNFEAHSQPMVSNEVEEIDHVPIAATTH